MVGGGDVVFVVVASSVAAADLAISVGLVPVAVHPKNPTVWEAGTVEDVGDVVTTKTIKNHVNEFIYSPCLSFHHPTGGYNSLQ